MDPTSAVVASPCASLTSELCTLLTNRRLTVELLSDQSQASGLLARSQEHLRCNVWELVIERTGDRPGRDFVAFA
jgi:hypothetical protein